MNSPSLRPLIPPSVQPAEARVSLTHQALPAPPDRLYTDTVRDLLSLASPDSPQMDYWAAVQLLNDTLKLGLNAFEHNVVAVMVTGLSQTTRFRNELFLDPKHGDNSAIHSCHTAVLGSELFRRAGLLGPDRQTEDVIRLRIVTSLSALMHDMGEMFGEPSTLAERQNNAKILEANDYERPAFIGALRLAHWAVENLKTPEFYRKVNEMRAAARDHEGVPRLERIAEQINSIQSVSLSEAAERSVAKFINAYDIAENPDPETDTPERLFAAAFVKTLERCQGTRHYLRFGTKSLTYSHLGIFLGGAGSSRNFGPVENGDIGDTIAFRYHYPPMVVKQGIRMEEHLGKLWNNAETEAHRALARQTTDAIYALIAEFINAGPAVYDMRTIPQPDPFVTKCFATFRSMPHLSPERRGIAAAIRDEIYNSQVRTVRELRERRQHADGFLFPSAPGSHDGFTTGIFRRDEMVSLYMRAIDRGYIPFDAEPLISKLVTGFPTVLRKGPDDSFGPERRRLSELRSKAAEAGLTARSWSESRKS